METGFRHDAVLYAGERDFVERMARFARDAVRSDEPILVMVRGDKVEGLRAELGSDADRVTFADMSEIGRNPSRIISAWEDFFLGEAKGRYARGIGEPIWVGRSPEEIVESQRHESLLNLAFREVDGWLVCPYDVSGLDAGTIEEAHRSHPVIQENGSRHASARFRDVVEAIPGAFDAPLEDAPPEREQLVFGERDLHELRAFVSSFASRAGLPRPRAEDAVVAVSELASNSIRHGGGEGTLLAWLDSGYLVAEVRDRGRIQQPLVGRLRPSVTAQGGFGLWLVNQLSDLVQIRTYPTGSVVRVRFRLR